MLNLKKWHYGELEVLKKFKTQPKTYNRITAVVVMVLSFFYFFR